MNKTFIFDSIIFVFLSIALIGCTPSGQSSSIPLEIDDQKISLEFQQNNVNIPIFSTNSRWKVTLSPEPFSLTVNGDKKIASIMAVKSADLIFPLQQSSKPLVTIPGTGNIFSQNDLYLIDQPIEIYDVNANNLQHLSYFLFSPEQSTNTVNTLKSQLGAEPLVLFSPRSYLDLRPGQDQNYRIKTISGSAIQSGESLVLLIFVEKQSSDPLFKILKWVEIDLVFE